MAAVALEPALDTKLARLRAALAALPSALVAFSGGVDSSLLLRVARALDVTHVVVQSNELEIPSYAGNPTNRCYLCKDRLYDVCAAEARARGIAVILDGVNVDDLGDYRPGLRAADERRVRHPLVDADLRKAELRTISRALGLATWDKPASPCLSSRFPYGTEITLDRLRRVAAAEASLRALGFREVRVRFHGAHARVEVGGAEIARFADETLRAAAIRGVRDAGFREVTIDPRGFRSGSLNEGVVGHEASSRV